MTRALKLGRAAVVAGVAGVILAAADLATRPGCPERYVRLIDPEWFLPFLAGSAAITGGAVWARARLHPAGRWVTGLAWFALAVAALCAIASGALIARHQSSGYDPFSECWTF